MSHEHDDRGSENLSGWFYFPCYPNDDGSRPAPSFVCSWRSPAILVNGSPHDGKLLPANEPLQLSAIVTNSGALAAPALVTILYAPMSAQFTDDLQIAAQFSDFWLAGETKTVGPSEWIVPPGLPSHICLLAAVDSPLDPIPLPLPQSIADRHYAQCNLDLVVVVAGKSVSIPILLGGGLAPDHRMHVKVRADLSVAADEFARSHRFQLDADLARSTKPVLVHRSSRQRGNAFDFEASEGHQEAMLVVDMPKSARPGQAVVLTVEQFATSRGDDVPTLTGSCGVVLVVAT